MCRVCVKYGVRTDRTYKRSDSDGFRRHFYLNAPHHVPFEIWRKCFGGYVDENCYALRFKKWNALIICEHDGKHLRTWMEDYKRRPQPDIPLPGDRVGSSSDKDYNWSHDNREEKAVEQHLESFFSELYDEHQDEIPRLWSKSELLALFKSVSPENVRFRRKSY